MKRREFLSAGILTTAAVSVQSKTAQSNNPGQLEAVEFCHVVQTGIEVEQCEPTFGFKLNVSAGLNTLSWETKLRGRTIQLAGDSELGVDLDAGQERIWILGPIIM
jgi:hypothetical protein